MEHTTLKQHRINVYSKSLSIHEITIMATLNQRWFGVIIIDSSMLLHHGIEFTLIHESLVCAKWVGPAFEVESAKLSSALCDCKGVDKQNGLFKSGNFGLFVGLRNHIFMFYFWSLRQISFQKLISTWWHFVYTSYVMFLYTFH